MKKYIDDEKLIHTIQDDGDNIKLISEIIVFGEFFKRKYQEKSISTTIFDTVDLALADLKSRTNMLSEINDNKIEEDTNES